VNRKPIYKRGDRVKVLRISDDIPSFVGVVKSHCPFGLYYKIVPVRGGGGMTLPPTMIEGIALPGGRVKKPT